MSRFMFIDPRGPHRLRKAMLSAPAIKAKILQTDDGVVIEFSNGRDANLVREPHVSTERFMAAAVQWARRHGATSVEIELK